MPTDDRAIFDMVKLGAEEAMKHWEPDSRWLFEPKVKCITVSDRRDFYVEAYGVAGPEPPRYFKTFVWIDPEELRGKNPMNMKAFANSWVTNLMCTLETFLDPKCECKPGPTGQPGEHCDFHKKVFGE